MKIQSINFGSIVSINNIEKNRASSNNLSSFSLQNDSFVKSNKVAFKGESNIKKTDNIIDVVENLDNINERFFVGLIATLAMAQTGARSTENLLNNGKYEINTKEQTVNSDRVKIDANKGIYKVDELGIDINLERFDYYDVELGFYQNKEKGIDIDLMNEKYVDPENGILLDREKGLSIVITDEGIKSIIIPDFSISSMADFFNSKSSVSDLYDREVVSVLDDCGDNVLIPMPEEKYSSAIEKFLNNGSTKQDAILYVNLMQIKEFDDNNLFKRAVFGDSIPSLNVDVEPDEPENQGWWQKANNAGRLDNQQNLDDLAFMTGYFANDGSHSQPDDGDDYDDFLF